MKTSQNMLIFAIWIPLLCGGRVAWLTACFSTQEETEVEEPPAPQLSPVSIPSRYAAAKAGGEPGENAATAGLCPARAEYDNAQPAWRLRPADPDRRIGQIRHCESGSAHSDVGR